jgi:excisionase family DNA binding protein
VLDLVGLQPLARCPRPTQSVRARQHSPDRALSTRRLAAPACTAPANRPSRHPEAPRQRRLGRCCTRMQDRCALVDRVRDEPRHLGPQRPSAHVRMPSAADRNWPAHSLTIIGACLRCSRRGAPLGLGRASRSLPRGQASRSPRLRRGTASHITTCLTAPPRPANTGNQLGRAQLARESLDSTGVARDHDLTLLADHTACRAARPHRSSASQAASSRRLPIDLRATALARHLSVSETAELLTLQEASQRVRLSPWALRRAISRGELDASKPAGRIRISEQAIEDWLKLTRVEPDVVPAREALCPMPAIPSRSKREASFRARLQRRSS